MFGSDDHLGFGEDELDRSRDTRQRNDAFARAVNGVRVTHLALAVTVVPGLLAVLVQTTRSDASNRWTTFWCVAAVLVTIALIVEVSVVRKQLRRAHHLPGTFIGDERA